MRSVFVFAAACVTPASSIRNDSSGAGNATADSTLAVFEPLAGHCVLRRIDPVARTDDELARFPGSCQGARIAWRADLRRAAVWFDPGNLYAAGFGAAGAPAPGHPDEEAAITERRYEVDLGTHAVVSLHPPAHDAALEIAYGADGSLLAFAERDLPNAAGKLVTVEGRLLNFTQLSDGLPAAAITYRHDGADWKLASVEATTTGWDYARGWSASPEASGIGPRSAALLRAHADTAEIDDPATRTGLDRIAPPRPDGDTWAQLVTPHGPIYIWMFNAEFVHTTGRIAWAGTDGAIVLLPALGFTGGELVAIASRGRYLLIAGSNAGMYPRLYDLVARRLIYTSETARAVTLWPAV